MQILMFKSSSVKSRLILIKTIVSLIISLVLFSFNDVQAIQLDYYHAAKLEEKPKRVIRDFLKWYKNNRENLGKFKLVSTKSGDGTRAYRVDFQETEKYLSELKKSGFVSDQYIASFKKYFEESDAKLKRYPQYDGPAEGFGFDLVLKAQDPREILDHINKMRTTTKPVNDDTAKVYVRFPTVVMLLKLTKTGKNWLIDSLDYI